MHPTNATYGGCSSPFEKRTKCLGRGAWRTDLKTTSIKKHNFKYEFNVLFNMIWFSSDWIAVSILLYFFRQSLSFCVHEYVLCVCRCNAAAALCPVVKQMLPSVFTHLCTLYPMPSPKMQWCHAKWGTQWILWPAEYRYESWVRLVCNLDLFLMLFYLTCFTFLSSCI